MREGGREGERERGKERERERQTDRQIDKEGHRETDTSLKRTKYPQIMCVIKVQACKLIQIPSLNEF